MQIRRVLLLFALVLGLSALVASIAPPPDTRDESPEDTAISTTPSVPGVDPRRISLAVRPPGSRPVERSVPAGSSVTLFVTSRELGDVVIDGLGLRQTAGPLAPARFDLLAEPVGQYAIAFVPLRGERRIVGRLSFGPPQRGR